jgi:hypothetical protein
MATTNSKAWGLVFYYTLLSWMPVAVIVLLSNTWYWIILKLIAGLIFYAVYHSLTDSAMIHEMIGFGTGMGFIINAILFGLLLYFYPRANFLIFFIVLSFFVNQRTIKKYYLNGFAVLEGRVRKEKEMP